MIGALNLGGSVEPLANAVGGVGAAVEKGATTVLIPCTRAGSYSTSPMNMATRVNVQFYSDAPDALLKALLE